MYHPKDIVSDRIIQSTRTSLNHAGNEKQMSLTSPILKYLSLDEQWHFKMNGTSWLAKGEGWESSKLESGKK
jgi:hypothetical protein